MDKFYCEAHKNNFNDYYVCLHCKVNQLGTVTCKHRKPIEFIEYPGEYLRNFDIETMSVRG